MLLNLFLLSCKQILIFLNITSVGISKSLGGWHCQTYLVLHTMFYLNQCLTSKVRNNRILSVWKHSSSRSSFTHEDIHPLFVGYHGTKDSKKDNKILYKTSEGNVPERFIYGYAPKFVTRFTGCTMKTWVLLLFLYNIYAILDTLCLQYLRRALVESWAYGRLRSVGEIEE